MALYRNRNFGLDLNALAQDAGGLASGDYQTDWPGVINVAQTIATDAGILAPGAGVLAPSAAPPLLQAPPANTPGLAPSGSSFSLPLLIGAAALAYFVLKN